MKLFYLAAAGLLVVGSAAFAGNGEAGEAAAAEANQQASQAKENKKEKQICRSERVTGSLTRVRRICMSQAEWDDLAAATHKDHSDRVRTAAGGTNSSWSSCNAPGAC